MKINDEGTSNAAHWHERAMKAEARLQKIMARCADLLDEDQFNELDAIASSASGERDATSAQLAAAQRFFHSAPAGCNHFPGQVNCEWCIEPERATQPVEPKP